MRDHCHVTGKYRGSAHLICNLKLKISAERIKIPVIFHNLKNYDSHFIIQKLGELIEEEKEKEECDSTGQKSISIKVIPCNAEKYMAFYIKVSLN